MDKDPEQTKEETPESPPNEPQTQPQQPQEEESQSSDESPQTIMSWETMKPQELASFLGLPEWTKVWLSEDKEEEDWTVTYSIPNKPDLREDIDAIKQVIKENKHLSSLCRFKYQEKDNDLIIKVFQENQFSECCPIKSKLKIGKMVKEVMKTVHGVAKDYVEGNPSSIFSVGAITVLKKVVKINLVHGYLQNIGKNVNPKISHHLSQLLEGFVNKQVHFKSQLEKNIVLKQTFEHLLAVLKTNNFLIKKVYKEHPLFLDSDEKIRLINIVNDYNQHVFSKKFKKELSQDIFTNVKNIFVDQTQYWAFLQRIDGSTDPNASNYNWCLNLKPELRQLVKEFNKFMKENTTGTVALKENRFTFQLRFIRNLIYHCNDYKEQCQNIFNSSHPNDIIEQIEQIFPKLITFVYDYFQIQKNYFETVSEGKIPQPFKFTLRNQSNQDIDTILLREKAVFKDFYNKVVVPESRNDFEAKKKIVQLRYKIQFYKKEDQLNEHWTKLIPIDQNLRNDIDKYLLEYEVIHDEILRQYLVLKQILRRIAAKPEMKDLEKQALAIYMEKGQQYSVYSCLNLIGQCQSELQKETIQVPKSQTPLILDEDDDYRYVSITRNVRFPPRSGMQLPVRMPEHIPSNVLPIRPPSGHQGVLFPSTCQDYMNGKCRRNNTCNYIHPITCQAFLNGNCQRENCGYFHIKNLCPYKSWKKCPKKKHCGKVHFPVCPGLALIEECEYGKKCFNYHPPVTICRYSIDDRCTNPQCKYYHPSRMEKNNLFD